MRQQRPLGINEASHAQATWARLQPEVPEMDPAPQSGTHKMHLSAVPRLELSDRHWGTKCESHGHHWGYWGLEHWLCKDRLWELGLFSLRGDGFWGIQLMSTDAQQKREYGGRLFSDIQLPDDRQKLQVEINQFWLNLIFFFFFSIPRVVKHWDKLPKDAVRTPCLEILKILQDKAMTSTA